MSTSTTTLLEREMYSEAEAARLLNVAPSTLHYWLEGKTGPQDHTYLPVIRVQPKGAGAPVTWAEFIEAGLLSEYRRRLKVPLPELRLFIESLRERLGVPYPLADRRPWTSGKNIVLEAQTQAGLPSEFALVALVDDQLLLTGPSESFLDRATWHGHIATGWRPHAEPASPVRIDPDVRFGRPAVGGVSTETLWEHSDDGEDDEEIAHVFGLTPAEVSWAVIYEKTRRTKQVRRSA